MSCLSEEAVISFASGTIRGDAIARLEEHLDVCRTCRLLVAVYAAQTGERKRERDTLSAFAPGDVLAARYEIISLLGRGGMGEVYAARDLVLGEVVALKTIAVGTEAAGDLVTRLKAELQLARRVTHRNVCRVFDVGFHAETQAGMDERISIPFFTMELLQGETLRKRLRRLGPLPPEEVGALLEQMAEALDAAHAASVVHTDLKSDNVMLVPEPAGTRVVIMDFGLAQTMDGRATMGAVAGTLGYMAPEQLAGQATGPATDIYALGVVLFEALTARLPTAGLGEAVALGGRSPTPAFIRALPDGWEAPLRRCLDPSPAARFARASQLKEALAGASKQQARAVMRSASGRQPHLGVPAVVTIAAGLFVVGIGTAALVRTNARSHSTGQPTSDVGLASKAALAVPARPAPRHPPLEARAPTPAPAGLAAKSFVDAGIAQAGRASSRHDSAGQSPAPSTQSADAPVRHERPHAPTARIPPARLAARPMPDALLRVSRAPSLSVPAATLTPLEDDDFIDPFAGR